MGNTCGDLMDIHNCCITDVKKMKVYHVGCAPQKEIKKEIPKREVSDSEKLDAILSMVWQMRENK